MRHSMLHTHYKDEGDRLLQVRLITIVVAAFTCGMLCTYWSGEPMLHLVVRSDSHGANM